jgi:hypothetical protein
MSNMRLKFRMRSLLRRYRIRGRMMSLRIAMQLKANNSAAEFKEDYLAQE